MRFERRSACFRQTGTGTTSKIYTSSRAKPHQDSTATGTVGQIDNLSRYQLTITYGCSLLMDNSGSINRHDTGKGLPIVNHWGRTKPTMLKKLALSSVPGVPGGEVTTCPSTLALAQRDKCPHACIISLHRSTTTTHSRATNSVPLKINDSQPPSFHKPRVHVCLNSSGKQGVPQLRRREAAHGHGPLDPHTTSGQLTLTYTGTAGYARTGNN